MKLTHADIDGPFQKFQDGELTFSEAVVEVFKSVFQTAIDQVGSGDVQHFTEDTITYIATEFSSDLKTAVSTEEGLEIIRWNNRCIGGLLRGIFETRMMVGMMEKEIGDAVSNTELKILEQRELGNVAQESYWTGERAALVRIKTFLESKKQSLIQA